jgi:hypothetical protein
VSAAKLSVVIPLGEQDPALVRVIEDYSRALGVLDDGWELLLVPARDRSIPALADAIASHGDRVRLLAPAAGWGAAVTSGLSATRGEILCYANWRRTPSRALAEMIELALRNPHLVLRANRRTRDSRVRRLGSLLFNVECRLLLQIPAWDVNGTPKVFPRAFEQLLSLQQSGNLLDAEFAYVCERAGYPTIEVPIDASPLSQRDNRLGLGEAVKMYLGVARLGAPRR